MRAPLGAMPAAPESPRKMKRSGIETGFRLGVLFTLDLMEKNTLPLDAETLGMHLGIETDYVRKLLRELHVVGLMSVRQEPTPGAPPTNTYTLVPEMVRKPSPRARERRRRVESLLNRSA